jgi:hypothetical protein
MGVEPSMETMCGAYDHAAAERCFATQECELINRRT